ncbi:MAG TPA: hypothetical protein VH297_01095 [Gaiellaceae bacterium]
MRQPPPPTTALALGLATLLLATFAGSAAAAKRPPLPKPKTRTTPGRIEALAMDGTRVAYDVAAGTGAKARCNTVYVWNVARKSATRVSGRPTCGADSTSTGAGVRELALAGGRAAWIVNQGGNSESGDYLYVSSVARPGEHVLATAFRTGDTSGVLTGNWLGGLVGAGSFLALDHWATDSNGAITTARLRRVGSRLGDLAEGAETMTARSTDGRQVAVLRTDGTVGLYSTHGALLRTVMPSSAVEVALRRDYLAVLTTARTVEVFNSHSGRKLRSWHVAAGAAHLDISSGLAAYAAGSRVHVVRLSTGKSVFGARAGAPVSAVALEPAGLVYASGRGERPARIVYVPMGRVLPRPPRR